MSEFLVKLNNGVEEQEFLKKLEINFNTINSKNILLNRTMAIFPKENKLYVLFNITPAIPSVMLYASSFTFLLYGSLYFIFGKIWNILLIGGIFLFSFHFFWTKYFFYLMLKLSTRKHNIKTELI